MTIRFVTLATALAILAVPSTAAAKNCADPGRHWPITELRAYHTTCERAENVSRRWAKRIATGRCQAAYKCAFSNAECRVTSNRFRPPYKVRCEATDGPERARFVAYRGTHP